MKKNDLKLDMGLAWRKQQINGAFIKSFLRGVVVTLSFMGAGKITDFFLTTENRTIIIIVYVIVILLSMFLIAQLVSKLLQPWGFKGFSKHPDENMTIIKFFAGAVLGIIATVSSVMLVISLVSLVIK